MKINKLPIKITPSPKRMLLRPFIPKNPAQVEHILFRIFSTEKESRKKLLDRIYRRFNSGNEDIRRVFLKHFENVRDRIPSNQKIDDELKQLIGAYFTQQYALESTAIFNPSIVPHPVQNKEGVLKFIMSLRAIGEGHISSIVFREGEIDSSLNITLYPNSPIILEPERKQHQYEKKLFIKKANEVGILNESAKEILEQLNETFNFRELEEAILRFRTKNIYRDTIDIENTINAIRLLALCNFTIIFSTDDISAKAIYPASPSHSNGLEDARFVRFIEEDGSCKYYATFTAYDGRTIMPEMLETYDFNEFKISTLNGPAVKNKGMALFPRKINGMYMMLGRQDNESLYIMKSDNPYFWYDFERLIVPTYYWEYIQIGNCGSPIEIEEGWLVLTHGVGPVRSYSIGAVLLDKDEPWIVKGRLEEPLLEPTKEESYGYVPNVLYTCGALVLNRTLILPYAMSDVATTFATVELDEILRKMV
ncbi:MAG TPA: glycoside hydrolase family 130 protein [Bacteroidales bacterium]|nr:glycoside hydrolase family 130 protein [Bacteroidales bacterium]